MYGRNVIISGNISDSGYIVGKYYMVKSGGKICPARVSFR